MYSHLRIRACLLAIIDLIAICLGFSGLHAHQYKKMPVQMVVMLLKLSEKGEKILIIWEHIYTTAVLAATQQQKRKHMDNFHWWTTSETKV